MNRDEYKEEVWRLSSAIDHLGGVLVPIEEALGLEEPERDPQPHYADLPRRLNELVDYLVDLGRRLEAVQKTVIALKDTVS